MPIFPSPMTSRVAFMPRSLRSLKNEDQLSIDSRCPGWMATTTFRPSLRPAMATRRAAFSFSKPAFT